METTQTYNFRMGAEDPKYIDISNNWEVNYWTSQLKCSREDLVLAANEIGSKIDDIRNFITMINSNRKKK